MPASTSPQPSILVVAAVVQRGDRVLVCQRPPGGRHAGLWEFPGGKVRAGETEPEALRRELAEELDLQRVRVGSCLFEARDPASPYLLRFLTCTVDDEPVALEHQAIAWCLPAQLSQRSLAPADARFVDAVLCPRR